MSVGLFLSVVFCFFIGKDCFCCNCCPCCAPNIKINNGKVFEMSLKNFQKQVVEVYGKEVGDKFIKYSKEFDEKLAAREKEGGLQKSKKENHNLTYKFNYNLKNLREKLFNFDDGGPFKHPFKYIKDEDEDEDEDEEKEKELCKKLCEKCWQFKKTCEDKNNSEIEVKKCGDKIGKIGEISFKHETLAGTYDTTVEYDLVVDDDDAFVLSVKSVAKSVEKSVLKLFKVAPNTVEIYIYYIVIKKGDELIYNVIANSVSDCSIQLIAEQINTNIDNFNKKEGLEKLLGITIEDIKSK